MLASRKLTGSVAFYLKSNEFQLNSNDKIEYNYSITEYTKPFAMEITIKPTNILKIVLAMKIINGNYFKEGRVSK